MLSIESKCNLDFVGSTHDFVDCDALYCWHGIVYLQFGSFLGFFDGTLFFGSKGGLGFFDGTLFSEPEFFLGFFDDIVECPFFYNLSTPRLGSLTGSFLDV